MESEYDQMAEEYDSTRDAATPDEVDAFARALEGSKSILDVGIGTGRFAKPLSERGFDVTGVDVSRRMLMKAREKGLGGLVLGDAYALPFRDKVFDGAIIVHVLHVVVDWVQVVREIGRTTKGNVATILRVPVGLQVPAASPSTPSRAPGDPRVRPQHRMWQNEQELRAKAPPVHLERVRDEVITLSLEDAIRRLEAKRPFAFQMIPPEAKQAMIEQMIAMRGSEVHRRIVEDVAVWKAEQFENLAR